MGETRISKRLWVQLVLTVLVVAALWTNPGQVVHEERLRETADAEHPVLSAFRPGAAAAPAVEYRNYLLFSETRIAGERATLGVLGRVFVSGFQE